MALELVSVADLGDDVLGAVAHDEEGNEFSATGWVSATTNHYDPESYDSDGNLVKKAKPRAMTPAEVTTYALSLFAPQIEAAAVVEPTPIAFE